MSPYPYPYANDPNEGDISKDNPPDTLRRPSGAEEGEAACRGRRGGVPSPTNKEPS